MKKRYFGLILAFLILFASFPVKADVKESLKIERISGKNRYETAAEISEKARNKSEAAIIASGEDFPDALAGGQLAVALDAPVLLTGKNTLDSNTNNELLRLGVKTIYLLGGEGTISKSVENELKSIANVVRIGGSDRYETSELIAKKAREFGLSDNLVIASGRNYADALSSGGYIAKTNNTMVLSDGQALPTIEYKEIIVFGGKTSLEFPNYTGKRIWGSDRYATSLAIAKQGHGNSETVILTSGEDYPDALTAISLSKQLDAPIILVKQAGIDARTKDFIESTAKKVVIIGGEKSISNEIEKQLISEVPALPSKPEQDSGNKDNNQDKDKDIIGDKDKDKDKDKDNGNDKPETPEKIKITLVYKNEYNWIHDEWVEKGQKLRKIEDPVKPGHIFKGWFNAEEDGELVDITKVTFDEDTTLYGRWEQEEITEAHFEFDKKTQTITKFLGEGIETVEIPEKIEGVEVKHIGAGAFITRGLKHIIIPETVISIGEYAFQESGLETVELSKNLQTIKCDAFRSNNISEIELPDTLTELGEWAFDNNKIERIIIPESITKIESYVFRDNNIKELSIPDNIITIRDNAFYNNQIEKLKLGSGLTYIGDAAFANNNITEVKLPSKLDRIERSIFENNKLVTIEIPEGIYLIEGRAFADNDLVSVKLPSSLQRIGKEAFKNNNLTEIEIPENVYSIYQGAFQNNNLMGINLPNKIKEISAWAFADNEITEVVIPENIRRIGERTFVNNKLSSVTLPENLEIIEKRAFENNQLETINIPSTVKSIETYAFWNNLLTEVTLPEGCTLGYKAFDDSVTVK